MFTDHQAYFECNVMNCYKSFFASIDMLRIEDKSQLEEFLHYGIFSGADGDTEFKLFEPTPQMELHRIGPSNRYAEIASI